MKKTTDLQVNEVGADTDQPAELKAYIVSYMESGNLPVEIFNQFETSGGTEPESLEASDEPLFGTHIREAIDVLRGRR